MPTEIIRLKQPMVESLSSDSTVTGEKKQKIAGPLPTGPSGVWRCPDSYGKAARRYQEIVGEKCGEKGLKLRQKEK